MFPLVPSSPLHGCPCFLEYFKASTLLASQPENKISANKQLSFLTLMGLLEGAHEEVMKIPDIPTTKSIVGGEYKSEIEELDDFAE